MVKSGSEQAPKSVFHPFGVCGSLWLPWCNLNVDHEIYGSCGSYEPY